MLDNLRNQESSASFEDDVIEGFEDITKTENKKPARDSKFLASKKKDTVILGLSSKQLFILLILLFASIMILGTMFLLITGRIALFS